MPPAVGPWRFSSARRTGKNSKCGMNGTIVVDTSLKNCTSALFPLEASRGKKQVAKGIWKLTNYARVIALPAIDESTLAIGAASALACRHGLVPAARPLAGHESPLQLQAVDINFKLKLRPGSHVQYAHGYIYA